MADPFSVQPPQWLTNLVGRPVDMGAVGTAIGGALSRATQPPSQNDLFQQAQLSRMRATTEAIRSKTALDTVDSVMKMHLMKMKTEGDLQFSEWSMAHPTPEAMAEAPLDRLSNPIAMQQALKAQKEAAVTVQHSALTKTKIGYSNDLAKLSFGDSIAAADAIAINQLKQEQGNDWTTPVIDALALAKGKLADRKIKTELENRGRGYQDITLLRTADEYDKAGNTEAAAELRAIVKKHSTITPFVAGTETTTEPNTGRKLTVKLTPEQLANTPPVFDQETKDQLSKYAEEKAQIASGDMRHAFGSARQPILDKLKIELQQKGIDADTGRRIPNPSVKKAVSSAIDVELNLAKDAIKAGVSLEKVAKRYKERTGQDFPTQ